MTDPNASQRDQIDELAESFVARFRAGERPSIEEYARRYPGLADELRQLLPALVLLEQHGSVDGEDDNVLAHGAARQPPREIGDFTIIREIGRGGMGVVYEAMQQSLGRHVALKVLSPSSLLNSVHLERFRLEARSAARLHHSHIVPVFGVGESDGLHYYAMQFIAGQSLDQVIDALRKVRPAPGDDKPEPPVDVELTRSHVADLLNGRLPGDSPADKIDVGTVESPARSGDETPRAAQETSATHKPSATGQFSSGSSGQPFYESVARVGLQVAGALAYAHAEGILHRDIKPSNLLLDGKGNTWVTDFGLVKVDDSRALTETGDFVGTLRYMAPERLEGWSDRRSDVYGLGVTLYELLTLRTFFDSANRAHLIDRIRHAEPQAPTKIDPAVPRDLETIVLKALAKEPAARYHTADEMAEDLRRFLADRPILARRSTPRERLVRWCRRSPLVASLAATAAVALIAGTIASTWQAIRATRAEGLAEVRLETERVARQEADTARAMADKAHTAEAEQRGIAERQQKVAEAERAEADNQRSTAERNYQKARAAVDRYFTLVSESTLLEVPGLESLRKDLLESALEFYEGAESERTNDPGVLVDVAVTHLRMSAVYAALNRADDFIAATRRALQTIDRLQRENGQPEDYERKLAGFWKGLRWAQTHLEAPKDMVGASQTMSRMEATWKKFVERYPDEAGFRMDLAYVQAMIGVGLTGSGRIKDGAAYFRKALAITETLVAEQPTVGQYRADLIVGKLALSRNLSADAALRKHPDEAIATMRQAVDLSEGLVAEIDSVPLHRALLAESLQLLGDNLATRKPESAEPMLHRARELAESLMRQFPDYRLYVEHWGRSVLSLASLNRSITSAADQAAIAQAVLDAYDARLKERPKDRLVLEQLAAFCTRRANQLPRQGEFIALAKRLRQRGLAVQTELMDAFPQDSELFAKVMADYRWMAGTLWGQNRADEAADLYQQAAEIIVKRANAAPVPREDKPICIIMVRLLASVMAWEGRTADIQEKCRLCSRATDVLSEDLQSDPVRQAYLAVTIRRFLDKFGPELMSIPEGKQLLAWSSPIVEQTILDVSLLAKATTNSSAYAEDRYGSGDAQRQLCHFLRSDGRLAQAFDISLLNLRSFASLASDRADQRFMIAHVLRDAREFLGARVDELLKDNQADEAVKAIRQTIDVIDKLITEDPKSGNDYRAMRSELCYRLSQVLADAGRADEATEARLEFARSAEGLLLKGSGELEFKGELTGPTFDWAMSVASLNTVAEGQSLIARNIESLESRIEKNPKDQMARFRLAALTHRIAERRFARAIDEDAAERFQQQALELFRGLAEEIPSDTVFLEHVAWSFHNLGGIARSTGRLDVARDHYQAAADTWSKMAADRNVPQRDGWFKNWEADNLVQLAEVLAAGAQPAEAAIAARRGVDLCESLVIEYPRNGEYRSRALIAARRLARLLVDAGSPQDAVEPARHQISLFEKQQADFPQENFKNTIGCACLTLCLPLTASGETEEGRQVCDKALELLAADTATLNYFAWPLAASKDVKPAVAALAVLAAEQATKAAPDNASLWNTLGVAQYRAENWGETIVSLTKAEELAPDKTLAFNGFFLAMAHWQLGHKDEARSWFDRSVESMEKHQPKNKELLRFRAEAEQLLSITQFDVGRKDVQ